MILNRLILGVSVLFFCCSVQAQTLSFQKMNRTDTSIVRPMPIPRPEPIIIPQIVVQGKNDPIILQKLNVQTEIIGNVATTTYDMTFYNPNNRVLEGELTFPLNEKQSVAHIALDIDGHLRDGVVVEKQKARQTFEAVVRAGVDPLLVEKTAGNQFKTRIYPLPIKGTRHAVITLEEALDSDKEALLYRLPLQFNQTLADFSLSVEIAGVPSEKSLPVIESQLSNFAFNRQNNLLRAEFKASDYLLNTAVSLRIPKTEESKVYTHQSVNNTYFYADMPVSAAVQPKTLPHKIAVYWDASFSGAKRQLSAEKELLASYLKKIGTGSVEFIPFNIVELPHQIFTIKNGESPDLFKTIDSIIYDGATQFDALDTTNLIADEVLLFTDGLSTYGKQKELTWHQPVYAITSATEYEPGILKSFAQKSGGAFINLLSVSSEKALDMLQNQTLRVVGYQQNGHLSEIYPPIGTEISENLTLAGILSGSTDKLTVQFGYQIGQPVLEKTIEIKAGGNNPAIERLWAHQKIKALELNETAHKEAILSLGQHYSIVTSNTSLLVLDSVSDYVQYEINPPAELQEEYNRLIAQRGKQTQQDTESALSDAISQAENVKNWWNRTFDQTPPAPKYEKIKSDVSGSQRGARNVAQNTGVIEVEGIVLESRGELIGHVQTDARMYDAAPVAVVHMEADSMAVATNDSVEQNDTGKSLPAAPQAKITVQPWNPDTPYLKILRKSTDESLYQDYLLLKKGYDNQPSFFFDITDEFRKRGMEDKAVIILSNILEMKLEDAELLRITANKLMEMKRYEEAIDLFQKAIELKGEDPQPYRDLALAYQENGEYQKAFDMFYQVLSKNWKRFNTIKQTVFVELNNLLALYPKTDKKELPQQLVFPMPVDIRVVLSWNTDNTDIDMHVIDPYKEDCYYSNRLTRIGSRYTYDFTQGYGPEEVMLKKAVNGVYQIKTNNFADHRQNVAGATTLYLDLYTHYGTEKQEHTRLLVRSNDVKKDNIIGEITFE